ncbi:transposable element Tcb2 transposase [Trichonephila clavipes]|nr:transposable element Tcb2 transposase [Trichonephila clavipes]
MKTAGWSTRRVAGQVYRSECAVRNCWKQWTREGTDGRSPVPKVTTAVCTFSLFTGNGFSKEVGGASGQRTLWWAKLYPCTACWPIGIYPCAENRVWSDQEDHEERGSKDRVASTCGPPSDSFNDTSRRRRSNCSTDNFQKPRRSKSLIQAPFPCTPFNTGTSATASTVVPNQINVECHRLAKGLCLVMKPGLFWGQTGRRPGPFLNALPGAIFQQDNARPHTARVAQVFLRHFQTLPWLARSPDLSPVEHVWDQLKWQMPSCHSVHDLELVVQDLWTQLPQDNLRCLINSMPDRVVVCIEAGGGPTRY